MLPAPHQLPHSLAADAEDLGYLRLAHSSRAQGEHLLSVGTRLLIRKRYIHPVEL